MKLEEARAIANNLLNEIGGHFEKYCICGSIRRLCEFVKDIDIVAIQKSESGYGFGELSLDATIHQLNTEQEKQSLLGKKIKRFQYKGISVDLYLADESTFETLKLIRTGSKEHNIRLTTLARSKGLKLFASGKGLCKIKGGIYNNEPEEIIKVVENTEDGILQNLLGRIPKPEER